MSRIVDLTIWMDGLKLKDKESVEDVIKHLETKYSLPWGYEWEITHEESFTD